MRSAKKRREKKPPKKISQPQGSREREGGESLGWITFHPRGFGFVARDEGGDDVFIPKERMGGAIHADRVFVRWERSSKGLDGTVIRVEAHGQKQVVGRVVDKVRDRSLEPDEPRLRTPIRIQGAIPANLQPGEDVVAEIVHYPEYSDDLIEVRIVRSLGMAGRASVEIEKAKIREGIIEEFPFDVLDEANRFAAEVQESEKRGREDLRHLDLVTIDPDDARDHDDAVWAERSKSGGFRVVIAIADVSHYVTPGTRIDEEAMRRGCSIYLPNRAIPMLPKELSSHLASLVPDEDRLVLGVEVELDAKGVIRSFRYIEGVMRSKARLSYGSVARALHLTELPDSQHEAEIRRPLLEVLFQASEALRAKRIRRGSLDFDLPEARVVLDPQSEEPVDVIRSRKDPGIRKAYSMIEEFMLLANEVVAEDLQKRGMPTIYRVHGGPDKEKIERFAEMASRVGYTLDTEAATKPKALARFLKRMEGTPHAQSLGFLLLRAMQQATYDTTNIGHFGLAAKDYLHFTSPIRRYPDLAVHRVVRAILRNERLDKKQLKKDLQTQAVLSSRLERRAMSVERDVADVYRALLMRNRVGERFDATLTSVTAHGFYASLDAPFVDVLCPVQDMRDDFYELDSFGLHLVGRKSGRSFGLGDRLTVEVTDVSIVRRQVIAIPLEFLPDDRTLLIPREHTPSKTRPPQEPRKGTQTKPPRHKKTNQGAISHRSFRTSNRRKKSKRK